MVDERLARRTHRRLDPLSGRWVTVSPHRTDRPWQGQEESPPTLIRPRHDPDCYLCPGNTRVGGERNPDYDDTWWFTNDFAALVPDAWSTSVPLDGHPDTSVDGAPGDRRIGDGLLVAEPVTGTCRVLCFSPRHDLSLSRATPAQVRGVVDLWSRQYEELAPQWASVQVFENRGSAMGASNPHPHGQLWATSVLPRRVATEDERQRAHHDRSGRVLLRDTLDEEVAAGDRVVVEGDHWVVVVPFWATWPYETLVLPRRHVRRMPDLDERERDDLARVLSRLLARFDNLFQTPFPYSMGWHVAPGTSGGDHWQLHGHFYPPLLRSATVRKFMVGFELLAEEQRDITPEAAATALREVSDTNLVVTPPEDA